LRVSCTLQVVARKSASLTPFIILSPRADAFFFYICCLTLAFTILIQDATYALKVGELSPVVETDSGTHVILRTA
jgi:hypothetical protein